MSPCSAPQPRPFSKTRLFTLKVAGYSYNEIAAQLA
jgi:hypothetical protein